MTYLIEAGLLLTVAPWAEFWDRHSLLRWWPALRPLIANAYVRGAVSGIGIVTLVAGLAELGQWLFSRRATVAPAPAPAPAATVMDSVGHGGPQV